MHRSLAALAVAACVCALASPLLAETATPALELAIARRCAPELRGNSLPKILLAGKCRTCHVQVQAGDVERKAGKGH